MTPSLDPVGRAFQKWLEPQKPGSYEAWRSRKQAIVHAFFQISQLLNFGTSSPARP